MLCIVKQWFTNFCGRNLLKLFSSLYFIKYVAKVIKFLKKTEMTVSYLVIITFLDKMIILIE